MAKYANISVSGSGHAGTELDPFTYIDLKTDIELGLAETYNIQGENEQSNGLFIPQDNQIYQAWDAALYGPFRIRDLDLDGFGLRGTWKKCILELGKGSTRGSLLGATFLTCYFQCFCEAELAPGIAGLDYTGTGVNVFKGGSARISTLCQADSATIEFIDCLVDVTTWMKGSPPP
jgi:hypothetical protein